MLPDVELALVPWAQSTLSVTACTRLPANLTEVLPVIRINVVGGTGDRFSADPRVDVDVYAATYEEARDLAAAVHDSLVLLRGAVGDLVIRGVRVDGLPAERPYDNTTLSRVGASYTVSARPNVYA